jgi:hypothetical protein
MWRLSCDKSHASIGNRYWAITTPAAMPASASANPGAGGKFRLRPLGANQSPITAPNEAHVTSSGSIYVRGLRSAGSPRCESSTQSRAVKSMIPSERL